MLGRTNRRWKACVDKEDGGDGKRYEAWLSDLVAKVTLFAPSIHGFSVIPYLFPQERGYTTKTGEMLYVSTAPVQSLGPQTVDHLWL